MLINILSGLLYTRSNKLVDIQYGLSLCLSPLVDTEDVHAVSGPPAPPFADRLFFEPFADRRFFIFSLSRHSQIGLVFTTLRSYNDV